MTLATDLSAMYADLLAAGLASSVAWQPSDGSAAVTFTGLLDAPDELLGQGDVQANIPSLRFALAAAPGLDAGERVVIDGATYELIDPPRRIGDGLECTVSLKERETA